MVDDSLATFEALFTSKETNICPQLINCS